MSLFGGKGRGGTGEFEEPSRAALREDHPVNGLGRPGEQDGLAGNSADGNGLECGGQIGGGNRGQMDLVAPAVDVGEVAADITGEDGDAPVGGGIVRTGNGPGALAHRLVGFGLPVGGSRAGGKLRGGGGGNLGQPGGGCGNGGIGGGHWRGGNFRGGWGGGGFFLGNGVGV